MEVPWPPFCTGLAGIAGLRSGVNTTHSSIDLHSFFVLSFYRMILTLGETRDSFPPKIAAVEAGSRAVPLSCCAQGGCHGGSSVPSIQLCVLGILGCLGNLSQLSRASTEFSLLSVPVALSGFTKMHGVCSLKWCWATSLLQDEQLLAGTKRALVGVTQSVPGCYGNCWESWLQFFILW